MSNWITEICVTQYEIYETFKFDHFGDKQTLHYMNFKIL